MSVCYILFLVMGTPGFRNSDERVHAMVIASQKIIELMGRDLSNHFINHRVSLLNISPARFYGSDAISLVLEGKERDIKKSLNQLRKICYQKEIGIESKPINSLPPALKGFLNDMEDDIRFSKIFSYCSQEYLEYCKKNNMTPHPEVLESIVAD